MTSNTTFSSGAVLTAAQMNNLPFGIMGSQSLTAGFATSAPHTTFQANGATLTITEISGRLYRINYMGYPYPNGGQQSIYYQFFRNATAIKDSNVFSGMMSTVFAPNWYTSCIYLSTASGSSTFTMRMAAATANTQVTDFGSAASIRQFWIEDLGKP
jgi:hypothetical protein